ncbi:MAG TPA: hypothetical protein VFO93_15945 [Hymenobacter sp.]|uniref:hypothetical protein n=1 Tax=Hymenobacter sp. TaxID=1898978 RepID=UPI002D7FC890|nr:hypothetical protein [Hymenobacter sp.]HET9505035.1 hypothetical protein [Hymenobacter sp.]
MANQPKPAWYGVAAVAIGTGIFFLATNKGRLFKKGKASVKALLSGASAAPEAAPTPAPSRSEGRTPTPENGHVRDVVATHLPPPETGSNFSRHGDVHGPTGEAGN